ncbi:MULTISPECIES: alpha/beta hydrolase [Actinomadura]|uniref:Alpha/beta hydrolase n=1 Tax=Actinomadura yumaensis TaxID=111807 RepID=A0ABW2CEV0_9ACTN|nr:alpha/beta hydrolase [Actinomadura sp. J1-007]
MPSDSVPPGPSGPVSRRARAAAVAAACTVRPLTAVIPSGGRGIALSRWIVARALARYGPAVPGTRVQPVDGPVPGEWVRPPGPVRDDAAILYLHGSAYMLASARTHRGLTSRLAVMTGLPVFAVDYRLAPEHRFPAAADDVRAAFDWLTGQGYGPGRIAVAGDSAGGHLAVDLALQLCRDGRPGPAAMALLSPLCDLSLGLARERERTRRDPMIPAARAARLVRHYIRDADPASPRLAFTVGSGDRLPPTLIQAGGAEMLAADAEHLAALLGAAGGRCELQIWPGQMHVFQALPRLIPEAGLALGRVASFLTAELAPPTEALRPETAGTEAIPA